MARLLIAVVLVVACLVGLGFYFEDLRLGSESADGTTHITLTINQKRIQEDEKKAVEKVHGKE